MGTKMYPNDELRNALPPKGPNLLKRFVRYLFSRAAAYDRGWTKGWDVGYDRGYEQGHEEGKTEGFAEGWDSGEHHGYMRAKDSVTE